jgi:hypothetical protein
VQNERILDVFPAATDGNRLVIAIQTRSGERDRFVLRQETFSSDVGWFVQSRVSIEPEQMAGLKAALTCGRTQRLDRHSSSDSVPAATILSFKSAAAG